MSKSVNLGVAMLTWATVEYLIKYCKESPIGFLWRKVIAKKTFLRFLTGFFELKIAKHDGLSSYICLCCLLQSSKVSRVNTFNTRPPARVSGSQKRR